MYSRPFAPKAVFFRNFEGFRVRRLLFLIIEGTIIGELKIFKMMGFDHSIKFRFFKAPML